MNVNEPIHCTSFVNVEAYVQTFKVKGEWGKEGVRNIFGRGGGCCLEISTLIFLLRLKIYLFDRSLLRTSYWYLFLTECKSYFFAKEMKSRPL